MLIHLSARDSHLQLIGPIAGSGKSTLLYVVIQSVAFEDIHTDAY